MAASALASSGSFNETHNLNILGRDITSSKNRQPCRPKQRILVMKAVKAKMRAFITQYHSNSSLMLKSMMRLLCYSVVNLKALQSTHRNIGTTFSV
mmetsp:Transcript_85152/g.170383  ORF Transcript_85152/g.170383 Transcript_85152/m.170383 type:complete len:96 (-) Transcript_85152:31-318(-)